ncbi:unnamed protein product [Bemisia tabaci]|uniref:60S ribosomal protein L7 n=2 Tax=Bemisia tabaci TaxID=7038 RepID=A0A9P0A068_BEMTA|nr:PREDICTED: 60S ribosomal protein L7 [Bemisia tabaci]CAH0380561.1 unnamed protein product [Bemisia tabaci]
MADTPAKSPAKPAAKAGVKAATKAAKAAGAKAAGKEKKVVKKRKVTAKDFPAKKLPAVPESILKKRKRRDERTQRQLFRSVKGNLNRIKKRRTIFLRAEKYVKEYRMKERAELKIARDARKRGNYYIPGEAKLAFVVRLKGINKIPPKPRKVMQLFRLRQINNGVFIKLNKATLNMLRIIAPYVTWGYPNLKSVRELLYKRGFARIRGQRIPITSNRMIETHLKRYNIICMEDLVHEIFTVGRNFKYATHFLWPFKLNTPTGGWKRKSVHYNDGGDFGNREDLVNKLLRSMV